MSSPIPFDDALGLMQQDFSRARMVILRGESGSGKSSAIRFLMNQHPQFRNDERLRIIEELRVASDLRHVISALRGGGPLLVASHLSAHWHRLLNLLAPSCIIELDQHPEKITRWLTAQNIPFSTGAVQAFCSRFGANYTDAQLVLAHTETDHFDIALGRFLKHCRLERHPPAATSVVLTMGRHEAELHYQTLNAQGLKQIP